MPERHDLRTRLYPTGRPVKAPPGWVPPLPRPRGTSPFHSQLSFVLTAASLCLLVIVCMGIGWLLIYGRRPPRPPLEQATAVLPAKEDTPAQEPQPPRQREKQRRGERHREREDDNEERQQKKSPPPPAPAQKDEPAPLTRGQKGAELTYVRDVLPILGRACLSCHGTRKRSAGLDLRTYDALVKGGDGGAGVVPGKPDQSPLYETIASGQMPPGKRKLTAAESETVRAWIAAGAKPGK